MMNRIFRRREGLIAWAPFAAVVVALVIASPVFAFAQGAGTATGNAPGATPASPPATSKLSEITVTGNRLYLPVVLQMVKAALERPVSYRFEDLDKLVCQFDPASAGGLTLDCRTNCQRWIENEAIQGVHVSTQLCDSGSGPAPAAWGPGRFSATVGSWVDRQRVNRGALLSLLKKLPPANSSYTLREMDHDKVVADFVFKNGNVVSVRRYYRLDLQIRSNGAELASPSTVALAGSPVTLTMSSPNASYRLVYTLRDEVTRRNGERSVKLSMKFYKAENDVWRLLGSPQIGLILGKAGKAEVGADGSGSAREYGITATASELSATELNKLMQRRGRQEPSGSESSANPSSASAVSTSSVAVRPKANHRHSATSP